MLKIKWISIIFVFFITSVLAQTNYYVSSSQGNDSNSGTSESSTWKSIAKVNSVNFQPGDNIKFECGNEWTGGINNNTKRHTRK